jgi:hypothetical protein
MVKRASLIVCLVIFALSCKKAEDRSCFKGIGDEKSLETMVGTFDTLRLFDDINYQLIPDTVFKVEVIGGENLIKHIEIGQANNSLTIENNNKCNFLRKFDEKVTVKIHVSDLNYIQYEGSEELKSTDTLYASELRLFVRDGAGDVDLTVVNGYTSAVIAYGFGNFHISGQTLYAFLNCNTNSTCDATALSVALELNVNSSSQGDMYVNAQGTDYFVGVTNQKGNIFYKGIPDLTAFKNNHTGEIINLNN